MRNKIRQISIIIVLCLGLSAVSVIPQPAPRDPKMQDSAQSELYWIIQIIFGLGSYETALAEDDTFDDFTTLKADLMDQWNAIQEAMTAAYSADQGAQAAKKGMGDGHLQMAKICFGISAAMAAAKNYAAAAAFAAMGGALQEEGRRLNNQANDAKPPINIGQQLASEDTLQILHDTLDEMREELELLYDEGAAVTEAGLMDMDFLDFLTTMAATLDSIIPDSLEDLGIEIAEEISDIRESALEAMAREESGLAVTVDQQQQRVRQEIEDISTQTTR